MLAFATNIRQPIDLQPDVNRLVGHCRLSLVEDGKICVTLTEEHYNQDLGARSLANAVEGVQHLFTDEYNDIDSSIIEDINTGPLQHFTISRIPIGDDAYDVVVSAGGLDAEVGDEENDDSEGMLQYDDVEEGAKEAQSSSDDNLPIWSLKKKQKKKNTS
jgi:hypothetical protein